MNQPTSPPSEVIGDERPFTEVELLDIIRKCQADEYVDPNTLRKAITQQTNAARLGRQPDGTKVARRKTAGAQAKADVGASLATLTASLFGKK